MVTNDVKTSGVAAKKSKTKQSAEKVGAPQPPSTLPMSRLRELPTAAAEQKSPAALDPGVKAAAAPAAKDAAAARNGAAASGGAASSASASASASGTGADLDFHMPGADEEAALRYQSALAELEALQGAAPRYDSRYDAQIRDLYEQIASRAPFRYDSATDPLYQQYRQDYTAQGRMAMRDTMGQAAGLTGGYGSSYAQSVSQQQYDAYLRRLADVLPETYGMALDAWQAEGQDLQRRYSAAAALEQSDYERYLDELGQYNRAVSLAREDAESAYERMIYGEEKAYGRAVDDYERRLAADERAYRRAKESAKSSSSRGGRRTKKTQTAQTAQSAQTGGIKAGKTVKRNSPLR